MATMTGGQALVRQLRRQGVGVIFGLPGDQIMYALDAVYDQPDIRFITTRHEQGTTYMADGYARAGGSPGVAFVVPGVGVYNASAGLATAYACSSPVFLFAGQVNKESIGRGLDALHDVHDQLDIVRPITKWAQRVVDPAAVPEAVRRAFHEMTSGRSRPVELEIPPETLAEKANVELLDPLAPEEPEIDYALVAQAAEVLSTASSPVLLAGGGVHLDDATGEFTEVAELLQAPVLTTREGKGAIDDRNPLSVGTAWNNRRVSEVILGSDVVLAVGTRLQGIGITASQRVIHLDVDPRQIGRQAPIWLGVPARAKLGLRSVLEELHKRMEPRPSRAAELRAVRRSIEEQLRAVGPQARMVEHLREAIPEDAIVAVGTTSIGYMCHMHFPVFRPRSYLSTSYMGTLGAAFPVALGAKVARPERPVVAIKGDGGFLFAATELATAVQYGINVVTLVFNDSAYGNSNRDQRERFGGREIGTELKNPDFASFARSFGAEGFIVKDLEHLGPVLSEALSANRPAVIECPIDRLPSPF